MSRKGEGQSQKHQTRTHHRNDAECSSDKTTIHRSTPATHPTIKNTHKHIHTHKQTQAQTRIQTHTGGLAGIGGRHGRRRRQHVDHRRAVRLRERWADMKVTQNIMSVNNGGVVRETLFSTYFSRASEQSHTDGPLLVFCIDFSDSAPAAPHSQCRQFCPSSRTACTRTR
jgi:hypothetical protein